MVDVAVGSHSDWPGFVCHSNTGQTSVQPAAGQRVEEERSYGNFGGICNSFMLTLMYFLGLTTEMKQLEQIIV